MIEGMILTVLGGLLSSALSGVVGNRADAAVFNAWRFIGKRLRENNDKPINHDLQRAVVRSYINALNVICDECLEELKKNKKEYKTEIQFLEDKKIELNRKLKEIEKAEYVVSPLEELNEIELLLTSEGTLAREQIEIIKEKLIIASIGSDNIPACFREKIEKPNAGLFELMSLFFAKEIKQNQVVRNIFEGQLLSKIDVKLNGQILTVDLIEKSLIHVASQVSEVLSITSRTETKVDEIATGVKNLLNEKAKKELPKIPDEIKALFDKAGSLINQGSYEEGREVTKTSLGIAKNIDNKVAIGRANYLLAVILHEWDKDALQAEKLLHESLECFKSVDSDKDIAIVLSQLGIIAIDDGRLDEASSLMTQAMEIEKRIDDKYGVAQALHQLGWIEDHRGHSKEAIVLYDDAIKYFFSEYNDSEVGNLKNQATKGIGGCYQHKGLIYQSLGRINDAEINYLKALDWYRKTDYKPEIAKIDFILSKLKFREADYVAGDNFLDEAIELYNELGDYAWQSRCYQLRGQVYFTLGKPDKAIELFLTALENANKTTDIEQQEHLLSTLGNAYLENKKPNEAKEYFEKARDLCLLSGLLEGYADSVSSLAFIVKNKDEKEKLLYDGIKSLEKSLYSIQSELERAFILGKIGSFYEKIEDFNQALNWYQKAKTIYESLSNILGIAKTMESISHMKAKLGYKSEAFEIYRSLKELLTGTSYYDLIANTEINLGIFYSEQDKLIEAKKSFEEAESISKKYSLENLGYVRDLLDKLNTRMKWRKPDEMSFEQLVKELFELVDWFPEAKDSILRLWYWGRKESLFGNFRKNTGVKFLICQDNLADFQALSNKLLPYSDLCLQVVSTEYPKNIRDTIPFPPKKEIFFECAKPYIIDVDGIPTVRFESGGFESRYSVIPDSLLNSTITGNQGLTITGMSMCLPVQAHQLLLSSTADDLLNKKIFFLPYNRFIENDKLKTDADLGGELGIIPIYFNTLPTSDSVNILFSKDIKLPILSNDESKELKKQIRKLRHSILQLNTSTKDRVQAVFNDLIFDVENLNDDYDGSDFIQMKVYVLETINYLDNSVFIAFVTS